MLRDFYPDRAQGSLILWISIWTIDSGILPQTAQFYLDSPEAWVKNLLKFYLDKDQ